MIRDIFSKFVLNGTAFRTDASFIGASDSAAPKEVASVYKGSQNTIAKLIGLAAVFLPILLWLFTSARDCPRLSISHHYYVSFAGPILVGILCFTGGALLAYRGGARWENRLANVAGVGAIGTALFPVPGPGCANPQGDYFGRAFVEVPKPVPPAAADALKDTVSYQLFPHVAVAHFLSAGSLFVILGVFCILVFTRVDPVQLRDPPADGVMPVSVTWSDLKPEKQWRNAIYLGCGAAIFLGIALMLLNLVMQGVGGWTRVWDGLRMTYRVETVMLWTFGLSWALKGRLWLFSRLEDSGPGPG